MDQERVVDEFRRDYGGRLSHLEGQVAGLITSVHDQNMKLDRIIEKMSDNRSVNWGWIASGLLMLGMIITLYTQPIIQINQRQTTQIEALQNEMHIHSEDITSNEVRLHYLEERINEIDKFGSRKWVGENPNGEH